jgi:putative polyketide hydroxylase
MIQLPELPASAHGMMCQEAQNKGGAMSIESGSSVMEVPVLILGGGVVGLSAALFLLHQGIRPLLVERHPGTSIHPRSRGINARTGELFRQVGLFEEIRKAGAALQPAVGMYAGETLAKVVEPMPCRAPGDPQPHLGMGLEAITPSPTCRCTQDIMEPILRARAVERGADVRFSTELESLEQDGDGVKATIVDRASGERLRVRAGYLIAADGVKGATRARLGIGRTGRGVMGHLLNVLLRVELEDLVRGRELSMCLVENAHLRGLWVAIDNGARWALHIVYRPERGETPADFPPERCVALARHALGISGAEIEVLGILPWQPSVQVAERFREGRVFLAGDSAHEMPPWAGQGANTGIAEVHNLAWKLAAVLRQQAKPRLLDTYERERRPIGRFAAECSARAGGRDGLIELAADGRHPLASRGGFAAISGLGYAYGGGEEARIVETFDAQPGTRAPHGWVEIGGERSSMLDLFGGGFVLITGPVESGAWRAGAEAVAARRGIKLRAVAVAEGAIGGAEAWAEQVRLEDRGAILVRPDGYVAWRAERPTQEERGAERAIDAAVQECLE